MSAEKTTALHLIAKVLHSMAKYTSFSDFSCGGVIVHHGSVGDALQKQGGDIAEGVDTCHIVEAISSHSRLVLGKFLCGIGVCTQLRCCAKKGTC